MEQHKPSCSITSVLKEEIFSSLLPWWSKEWEVGSPFTGEEIKVGLSSLGLSLWQWQEQRVSLKHPTTPHSATSGVRGQRQASEVEQRRLCKDQEVSCMWNWEQPWALSL